MKKAKDIRKAACEKAEKAATLSDDDNCSAILENPASVSLSLPMSLFE